MILVIVWQIGKYWGRGDTGGTRSQIKVEQILQFTNHSLVKGFVTTR
jgi:hypothetical protein